MRITVLELNVPMVAGVLMILILIDVNVLNNGKVLNAKVMLSIPQKNLCKDWGNSMVDD